MADTVGNNSNCVTADNLASMINIDKFNQMIDNTSKVANNFLTSYIQSQKEIPVKAVDLNLERYTQTALNKQREMIERHEKMMNELYKTYGLYETQLQSAKNTEDLYTMLLNQNNKLSKEVEGEIHTIEISDRKTYYENEQNGYAGWWSDFLSNIYKYIIIILILLVFMKRRFREMKLWGIIIALALYPILAYYLIELLLIFYKLIISNTKLTYLRL